MDQSHIEEEQKQHSKTKKTEYIPPRPKAANILSQHSPPKGLNRAQMTIEQQIKHRQQQLRTKEPHSAFEATKESETLIEGVSPKGKKNSPPFKKLSKSPVRNKSSNGLRKVSSAG